jgi:hypothetical protein
MVSDGAADVLLIREALEKVPLPDRQLAYAVHLRDTGATIAEMVTKTGIPQE